MLHPEDTPRMIAELFYREIDAGDNIIEVMRSEGSPYVSVYIGPFVWQIELEESYGIGSVAQGRFYQCDRVRDEVRVRFTFRETEVPARRSARRLGWRRVVCIALIEVD